MPAYCLMRNDNDSAIKLTGFYSIPSTSKSVSCGLTLISIKDLQQCNSFLLPYCTPYSFNGNGKFPVQNKIDTLCKRTKIVQSCIPVCLSRHPN